MARGTLVRKKLRDGSRPPPQTAKERKKQYRRSRSSICTGTDRLPATEEWAPGWNTKIAPAGPRANTCRRVAGRLGGWGCYSGREDLFCFLFWRRL